MLSFQLLNMRIDKKYKKEKYKMDNNFNQMNDKINVNGQMNNNNAGVSSIITEDIKSFNLTRTLIGAAAALVATILATVLWVFITGITGTLIYVLGLAVGFVGIFIYEKITKNVDIFGIIICLVFVLIAIYFGVRYGYIYYLAKETDMSIKLAKEWFEYAYDAFSEVKSEYVGLMIKSYIFSFGYTVIVFLQKFNVIKKK